jgi:hypothetical protein
MPTINPSKLDTVITDPAVVVLFEDKAVIVRNNGDVIERALEDPTQDDYNDPPGHG